jgi:tetratricopeptide (TPR) repeat protein
MTRSLLLLAGCESTPQAGGLDQALTEYHAGRYAMAHRRATEAIRSTAGEQRLQATYLAGLSAYRLGRLDDAERLLLTAARADDESTAANARAMLGLLRLDQGRAADAAELLRQAAPGLSGPDAAQAARYAAAASRQAGAGGPPRAWVARAEDSEDTLCGEAGPSTAYALQVGAFQDRRRAERAAADAAPVANEAGLGQVRIIPRTDQRGRQLYVVQLGRFDSRRQAAGIRLRLDRPDYIVVPAAEAAR